MALLQSILEESPTDTDLPYKLTPHQLEKQLALQINHQQKCLYLLEKYLGLPTLKEIITVKQWENWWKNVTAIKEKSQENLWSCNVPNCEN